MAGMCRSIKVLRTPAGPATADDLEKAALQFVRKISGFHKPSRMNQEAFDCAIAEIAASSRRLLHSLGPSQPRKSSSTDSSRSQSLVDRRSNARPEQLDGPEDLAVRDGAGRDQHREP